MPTKKRKPNSKPPSKLQKVSTLKTWVKYFRLGRVTLSGLELEMRISSLTEFRLHIVNEAMSQLRVSIEEDYQFHKAKTLKFREITKDFDKQAERVANIGR